MLEVHDQCCLYSILALVHQLCGSNQDMAMEQNFPGAIPVSMRRSDLHAVAKGRYMVSPKFDGERYLLLLTRLGPEKTPCAFLVNRRCRVFEARVAADDTFFDNTLLDGELLDGNYWAFDLITVQGRVLGKEPFIERHHLLCTILLSHLSPDRPVGDIEVMEEAVRLQTIISLEPTFHLRPKFFYPITQVAGVVERLYEDAGQRMDGLILMPTHEPVCSGTHRTQYKWKWQHTVDLQVLAEAGQFRLLYRSREAARSFLLDILADGILLNPEAYVGNRVPPRQPQRTVLTLDDPERRLWCYHKYCQSTRSGTASDLGIWELEIRGRVLVPVRLRLDKSQPNNDWTVQQTVLNADENITPTELISVLSGP